MESSKECNSSAESGWTMYLCSPKHSDESDIYNDVYVSKNIKLEVEEDSDDSMASDASSGPIRLVNWENSEIGRDMFGNKDRADEKNGVKGFSNKKAKYQNQEKDMSFCAFKEVKASEKCNAKVRKNHWFGKGK